MGEKRLTFLILILFPVDCQADCIHLFASPTFININDSLNYEKGAIVRDFRNDVGNDTLMFDDTGCDNVLAINRNILLLKENLLDPIVCHIKFISCQWRCKNIFLSNTLFVIIERISRGVFRFQEPSYYINVSESTGIGTKLHSFSVLDVWREDCIDLAPTFFTLVEDQQNKFYSVFEDGEVNIYLNHILDYEQPKKTYDLNVSAELNEEVTYTTLTVQVTDIDDMDPKFDYDEFILNITENNGIDNISLVTSPPIHATDRDTGDGRQEVYYRFEDDKNTSGCFTIDEISGNISVTCLLDREDRGYYKLILKAVQQNTGIRSCTGTLFINVLDINDNDPQFAQTIYNVNVTEHSSIGTTVVRLLASDLDENSLTRYVILPPYSNSFSSRENGDVIVQNPSKIDRETGKGTLILKVNALDVESGLFSSSTATVSMTLLDVNDKAPVFEIKAYGFPLPLEPNEGYEIGQVKAFDGDQANTPNSDIRYRLQQTLYSSLFSIDNKTGKITIQRKPSTSTGVLDLVVIAEDMGEPLLQSSAQIVLSRTAVNGNSVTFSVPVSVEEAKSRKKSIQRDTGKILNLKVSLDKMEEVVNQKYSCYLTVSAKFHNDSVVPGDFLQNTILKHIGEILALFSEHESQKLEVLQDTFTPAVIALIVICMLMFIGIIVFIGYVYKTTKKVKVGSVGDTCKNKDLGEDKEDGFRNIMENKRTDEEIPS